MIMTAGQVRAGTTWRERDPTNSLAFKIITVEHEPEGNVRITWARTEPKPSTSHIHTTSASTPWDYEEVVYMIDEELLP